MADVRPLRGIHFNPSLVKLGGVLSPPYDVLTPAQRDALYARDMRNVVRLELGRDYDDDTPGGSDRYSRARDHLESWLTLGVLVQDATQSFYVSSHEFAGAGSARRLGLLGTVAAAPWEQSELRPHERTLRAPKQDRLALLRATRVQTSPVFVLAAGATGLRPALEAVAEPPALLGGRMDGELGGEKHLLWRCDEAAQVEQIHNALAGATLYIADGHHRYETSIAYAVERRAAEPDAPADSAFSRCLVYLADADDPALVILPTHRLVLPGPQVAFSLDDLWARLDDAFDVEPMPDMDRALIRAAELRSTHNAFAAVAHDGIAVLSRPRRDGGSPRASLDVTVLEEEVLAPAGVPPEAITRGALTYTRDAGHLVEAVRGGGAPLGFAVNAVTAAEVIAVADAGETMPQKSTYFYPKVPAGLVLDPL